MKTIVQIAAEVKMSPKAARAKIRRHEGAVSLEGDRWVFDAQNAKAVRDILTADHRVAA